MEVYSLAWPNNQKKQEGFNSFAQLDWVTSVRQLVTLSLHIAPQKRKGRARAACAAAAILSTARLIS